MLLKLLSLLGIGRWISSVSSQINELMIEGTSGLEARKELIKQEWQEEKARLQRIVIYGVLCAALVVGMLMMLSMAVIITFWDSEHRTLVAWLVTLSWFICFLILFFCVRRVAQQSKEAFKYTKQELGEDWKTIKNQL